MVEVNWNIVLYTILIVVFGLVVLAIIKIISSNNPFGPILGPLGKILASLVNGCNKQDKCTDLTDKDKCLNGANCEWKVSSSQDDTDDEKKEPQQRTYYCGKTDPKARVSSGAFFSPRCGMGFAGLLSGIIFLLYQIGILGFIARLFGKENPNVKESAEVSGRSYMQELEEVVKKAFDRTEEVEAKQEAEAKARGEPALSEAKLKAIGELSAAKVAHNHLNEVVDRYSPKSFDKKINAYEQTIAEIKAIHERAREAGLEEHEIEAIDRASGEVKPPEMRPI